MCGLCPDGLHATAAVIEQADLGIETQGKSVDATSSAGRNKALIGPEQMKGNQDAIGTKGNTFVTGGCSGMNSPG
jgi:hypothetical protein